MADDAVTRWIADLKGGEHDAARRLWEAYFPRLLAAVRNRLPDHLRRAADEEDVALSAFRSFCSGVAADRFPELADPDNLWGILFVVAARKARQYFRDETRQKRGGGQVRGESVFVTLDDGARPTGPDLVAAPTPSPDEQVALAEQCDHLLDRLPDDPTRNVARLKLEGYTVAEIAGRLGLTHRSVQRRLDLIRTAWRDELAAGGGEGP